MHMGTDDVRVDAGLNKAIWSRGINHVPTRLRVRLSRLRNEKEGAENQFYTVVSYVEVPAKEIRHMQTQTVEAEAQ
eukprot:UN01376